MYKTIADTEEFIRNLREKVAGATHCEVVVSPPFTAMRAASDAARGSRIQISAQDVHWDAQGAHTGDVSAAMLVEAGATHVIVGHSERRHEHEESDEIVNRKLKSALGSGLMPIVCVGETLAQREAGQTESTLDRQFEGSFRGLTGPEFSRIMIAYEPVWAIGTGRTATPEIAAESHRYVRSLVARACGDAVANGLRLLYGGSVKPANIAGLMAQDGIDGALVGGASLEVESFSAIVNYPRATATN